MEPFMKCKSAIFVCLLIILSVSNSHAQTQNSVQPKQRPDTSTFKQYDSSLQNNHSKTGDTILSWRKSREFGYMKSVDSLLRAQKNLRNDTISITNRGKILRNQTTRRDSSGLNDILNSSPLKIFFWTLALFFIVLITYKFFFKNDFFGGMKNKAIIKNEEVSLRELADVSEYNILISDAETIKEFNLATRYLFLKTLKNLSDKGFIEFTTAKTNKEYSKEISQYNFSNSFEMLVHNYEYTWYGKFTIDEIQYQQLRKAFVLFNEKL